MSRWSRIKSSVVIWNILLRLYKWVIVLLQSTASRVNGNLLFKPQCHFLSTFNACSHFNCSTKIFLVLFIALSSHLLPLINFTLNSTSTISPDTFFPSFSFFYSPSFCNLQLALHEIKFQGNLRCLFFCKAKRKTSAASRRGAEASVVLCVVFLQGRRQETLYPSAVTPHSD